MTARQRNPRLTILCAVEERLLQTERITVMDYCALVWLRDVLWRYLNRTWQKAV
jgi:hypothetical protein